MRTLPERRNPSELTDPLDTTIRLGSGRPSTVLPVGTRGHVGGAACLVPDDPSGQRFLLLDGTPRSVGRSHDNDLVSNDPSMSRRHFQVYLVRDTLRDGSPDNRWLVEDLGATNGTFLGSEKLSREAPRPLPDGSVIRAGDRRFRFYRADGEHRPAVRRFLEDPDSQVFNAETVKLEIERLARRGGGSHLALVGIDDYSWFAERLDEVRRQRLLQHVGSQLLAALHAHEGGACLLGVVEPGTFSFFPAGALAVIHSALRESLDQTESVLRDMAIGGSIRVSASLVPVPPDASATDVIQRGLDKVRQATHAGGNRVTTTDIRPLWDKRRRDLWLARLPTMSSVALASAGSTGGTLGSDVVLRWVATAIDGLPSGTEVAICLSALPASWLIAASCSTEELRRVLAKTPDVRIRMADSGPTASRWVEHVESGFVGAAAPGRRPLWLFSQLEADYRSSSEGERLLKAIQGFEGMLRFVGNLTIACLAHARIQSTEASRATLRSATLRSLALSKAERFPASGEWLQIAVEIGEVLDASAVPAALRALLTDSSWIARCGKAAALRGEHVHGPTGPREATAELWACVKRCMSLFVEDELRIVKVDSVEARRGRRDRWRVHYRRLASAGPLGDVEEKEIEGTAVSRGLWAIEGNTWIPLSPLLELERCPDCNRFDLFAAKAFPRKEHAFGMVGLVDPHPWRSRVSEDEPELWLLLGALAEPSTAPPAPRDCEITGQFNLARIVALEESHGANADPRDTLPLDQRRDRGRDDD